MTEHKATSGQWEALEEHSWQDAYSCILELRARMGALEDAQRLTVKDSLTVPADSLTAPVTRDRADDRQRWMERQLEKPDSSLVERVAIVCAMPAKRTWDDQARAAILAIADWLDRQHLYVAAARLRQEVE